MNGILGKKNMYLYFRMKILDINPLNIIMKKILLTHYLYIK